jgi:hypothetical protein
MGDDWCRMRTTGCERDQLIRLINEEAQAFQRWGLGFMSDLYPLLENQAESEHELELVRQQWLVAREVLNQHVEIEEYDRDSVVPNCHRMSPIGRNGIFPGEWRIDAYRAFLPEEVPDRLKQWQGYINDVRAGAYRGYLFEWYLYATSARVHDLYTTLLYAAESVIERDNVWVVRLKATTVIDQIKDPSLKPKVYPTPHWAEWKDDTGHVHYEQDERHIQLQATIAQLLTLQREWNRQVPSNQKIAFKPQTFEGFLDQARWDQLDSLFNWLGRCVRDSVGLYLWV